MTNNSEYKISVIDDANLWNNLLDQFIDANIYQTWNYSKILRDEKLVENVVIYKGGEVIGATEVRIKMAPVLPRGVAYIYSGPLWRPKNIETKVESLVGIINALRAKYTIEKKLILRIRPFIFTDETEIPGINSSLFQQLSFSRTDKEYNTMLVDLKADVETIHKNLRPRWRNYLNQSSKNNLKVLEGFDQKLFGIF
ncbi:MAG TPA: hypothetical protein VH917_07710, partial [Ignavibacteriaceae bacterium]